ncbi:hypothetical protein O9K51_10748 [Purpureocillium lavendulum]|uniref:Uncharacterized protein n=1 Tax=Purpureocillium lavendulum TaxID=1247861 RepID=A0AB34FE16_9HYPO|nr:hypothetical protein O9K51_10748 [Purpureocillium lavendulum]
MDFSELPTTAQPAKANTPAYSHSKLQELANQSDASAPWEEMDELLRYRKAGKADDDIVAMILKHFVCPNWKSGKWKLMCHSGPICGAGLKNKM